MRIARDGTQNAVHSVFIILEYRHGLVHVRAFLAQRNRGQSEIRQIYDGPSFSPLSMSSRREDLMDIDMCTKPGDKEYYLANQLKKKCKKKKFQGIHDRFLRDHEFRVRMIEHNRDAH